MQNTSPSDISDLCPLLRSLRIETEDRLHKFNLSPPGLKREKALDAAIGLGKLIKNVILPLARESQPFEIVYHYQRCAESLLDTARPWVKWHDSQFPEPEDKTLLILDRIEQMENRIYPLIKRRERRSK